MRLCRRHGLEIRWFERKPLLARDKDREVRSMVRSFFEAPRIIYANRALQADPARLKFDLAAHIAHKVLHGGDGLKSAHATGGEMGGSPEGGSSAVGMNAQDVLHAWRDFECSFFAGALLAPRVPFRRFLARERHRVEAGAKLELTPAVVMRRMTKVSPYPYWHFFDAYPPGYLRAVYRGNGIPLPWGNLAQVSDPCPNWAVFRMIDGEHGLTGSQISVLRDGERSLLYCCHSIRVHDMAGNPHVLSVGVDLAPALAAHSVTSEALVESIFRECLHRRGEARIPKAAAQVITRGGQRAEHRLGRGRGVSNRRASSARAAAAARARNAARAPGPRGHGRSPTCARRFSGARGDALNCPGQPAIPGADRCFAHPPGACPAPSPRCSRSGLRQRPRRRRRPPPPGTPRPKRRACCSGASSASAPSRAIRVG